MKTSVVSILLPVLLVLVLLGGPVVADTLFLKDGREFGGKLVSDSGGVIKFKTAGGVLSFPKNEVDRVEKGATPADEYKARVKDLAKDDIEGRLALARWCREEKLFGQRKKLLRETLKICPDHPGLRKESGQAWRGGKWVKADDVAAMPVKAGSAKEIKDTRAKVAVPDGWERQDADKKVTASGPNNYATAPTLTVEIIGKVEPRKAFPEQDGWAAPEAVSAAGLSGLKSRRDSVDNLIGKVEWLAVLGGADFSVRIHLATLECESEDYGPAFGVALDSLAFAAPPADFVGKFFQLNLPKPKEEWTEQANEDGVLVLSHGGGDPTDFANLMIISGAPGEEADLVKQLHEGMVMLMKSTGDIEKEEEITLSGQKAKFIQGTFLQGGVPYRGAICLVEHGGRSYMIRFQNHEYGADKTGHALKTVLESFRFVE